MNHVKNRDIHITNLLLIYSPLHNVKNHSQQKLNFMSSTATTATPAKTEKTDISPAENQKGIENHKKAAEHHQLAAKNHLEASHHHETGAHDKAAESTVIALGHSTLANEHQKEDAIHHALKGK
jgi:hypothetical protein